MWTASGHTGDFSQLQGAFSKALQELLEEKHQYEEVTVDGQNVAETTLLSRAYWHPVGSKVVDIRGAQIQAFVVPKVRVWCGECQAKAMFQPEPLKCRSINHAMVAEQSMLLSYTCQDCARRHVTFFVTRRGASLELSGRDPFDALNLPTCLPRAVSRFYAEALVAHCTGHTLAALCLLREFLEQFWLRMPEVQEAMAADPGMTVEEIAEYYSSQLPLDFRAEYPNLGRCHYQLKAAIEGAEARPDLFHYCSSEIIDHLDGRRFRRLGGPSASPFGEIRQQQQHQAAI